MLKNMRASRFEQVLNEFVRAITLSRPPAHQEFEKNACRHALFPGLLLDLDKSHKSDFASQLHSNISAHSYSPSCRPQAQSDPPVSQLVRAASAPESIQTSTPL